MAHTSLSDSPEWLPEGRIVEVHAPDELRRVLELYGFVGIETCAVETLEQLEAKGEISKKIHVLGHLQALKAAVAGARAPKDKDMGLHFDLTVPFARYVVESANELDFPFEHYQIQKVWRGERPQDGYFRKFTQADIDVMDNGELPSHFEVDPPLMMAEALNNLLIPHVRVLANNHKVVQGVCESFGVTDVEVALRGLDRINKIGPEGVAAELAQSGIDKDQAPVLLRMAQTRTSESSEVCAHLADLGAGGEPLDEGLKELIELLDTVNKRISGAVAAGLKITRGPDYYTGSAHESKIKGHEALGSIYSGGRYGFLAKGGKCTYPGVGLSIDVSRLMSRMIFAPMVRASRKVPMTVVVAIIAEDQRECSEAIAAVLRSRGTSTDVAPSTAKFGKQIKFAGKRGIPFTWLPDEKGSADMAKDIRSGEQVDADLHTWVLPEADVVPTIEKVAD